MSLAHLSLQSGLRIAPK